MTGEIVIFDIDGTLADISAREHHVRRKPKNWDAFFRGMAEDRIIRPIAHLCNTLFDAGFEIVLFTGRPDSYRDVTEDWLYRHEIRYHRLLMRPAGDRRGDVVIKREMLAEIDRARISFIVEDRARVVEMWRDEGYVCLQCAPGDF